MDWPPARTYDEDGRIEALESAGATTYGYDDAFRITGITISMTAPGAGRTAMTLSTG
jgi:YD repeat-containing protein